MMVSNVYNPIPPYPSVYPLHSPKDPITAPFLHTPQLSSVDQFSCYDPLAICIYLGMYLYVPHRRDIILYFRLTSLSMRSSNAIMLLLENHVYMPALKFLIADKITSPSYLFSVRTWSILWLYLFKLKYSTYFVSLEMP